jgi:zona occludens toxin (predicted ATPase)
MAQPFCKKSGSIDDCGLPSRISGRSKANKANAFGPEIRIPAGASFYFSLKKTCFAHKLRIRSGSAASRFILLISMTDISRLEHPLCQLLFVLLRSSTLGC